MRRVAVVGSGIAGLGAAHALREHAQVTLYESEPRLGGHAHTVDVTLAGVTHGVDVGFLVFNHRTYPQLTRLFAELGIETAPADMSFSVQAQGLEWSGRDLRAVFAQKRNLVSPRFWRMLAEILRFNRLASALALADEDARLHEPLGRFLDRHGFGSALRELYLLPMAGSIWSCPTAQMLDFPAGTLIRFCHNHGLLQIADRPQWHTVRGGSRRYVERIARSLPDVRLAQPVRKVRRLPAGRGVMVASDAGEERYDDVVLACHSDQSLALLAAPTQAEREVLGAIGCQPNRAVLHTDRTLLPRRRQAWAAWNHECGPGGADGRAPVCLHYLINRLQPLPWSQPVIVTLNPVRPIDPAQVIGEWDCAHPVFDLAAIQAQDRVAEVQGDGGIWYCGAWTRYGFHEDGLASGLAVAQDMRASWGAEAAQRRAA